MLILTVVQESKG